MVSLGDEVRDIVSGFKGIAIARTSYLQGCDRICVQPPVDEDGKLPKEAHFDEPQLEVVKLRKVREEKPKTDNGGPDKYLDERRLGIPVHRDDLGK